jgi:uncharacterized protein with PIN domain
MKITADQDAIPYEEDFAAWAEQQAAFVLAGDRRHVDAANVSEELAALAARDKREIRNRLTELFEHVIKLREMPADDAAKGWRGSVRKQRDGISDLLVQSASLVEEVCYVLAGSVVRARAIVLEEYDLKSVDFNVKDAHKYLIDALLEPRDDLRQVEAKKLRRCVDKLARSFPDQM